MPSKPISLDNVTPIGRVTAVDTSRAFIQVEDHDKLKSVIVGHLTAIQGSTGHQLLIAVVERITRLPGEPPDVQEDDATDGTVRYFSL